MSTSRAGSNWRSWPPASLAASPSPGGIGSVGGALLGALFLGVVKNALPVVNISPFWQLAISGSAIIIAIAFNARASRVKGRVILKRAEAAA